MPYRVDVPNAGAEAIDRLIELGALDADALPSGGVAAVMPDRVSPEEVAAAVGRAPMTVSTAVGRDDGSVWVLEPRPLRCGRLRIVPAGKAAGAGDIQLCDGPAFGTGLHPTTSLCLEAIQDAVDPSLPDRVLDVGTGTGVLALAALALGVPRAVGLDIEEAAMTAAMANARLNGVASRLLLVRGGPAVVGGAWPLVLANVLAAPLIEMAPTLARRLGHHGRIVLSGVPSSVEGDVRRAYERQGLRHAGSTVREGWVALVLLATW